jgi:twitching motility protein PilT
MVGVTMDAALLNDAKSLLADAAERIPQHLYGVEKMVWIRHQLLMMMSDDEKNLLHKFMEECLTMMREMEASDVDMGGWGAANHIWFRIHGNKRPIPELGTYTIGEFDVLILNLLQDTQRDYLYKNRSIDFSYGFYLDNNFLRYRATSYFDLDVLALNMRSINVKVREYETYGFPPAITQLLSLEHTKEGLILVTGITGSGKSTTLDAIVDLNNRTVFSHIIIIASPVEFVHQSKKCIIRHREVGRDTISFKSGTVESLRQDPDIIVIGEMRDPETIMAAMEAADSGHKVLSTLHTSSAVESIERIIGEFPPAEQDRVRNRLADVLRCVISQKLIPDVNKKLVMCKEILVMTPSIRAAIKNNNAGEVYQMLAEGAKYGMSTMEQNLKKLVSKTIITPETAMNFSNNKRMMQQLMDSM